MLFWFCIWRKEAKDRHLTWKGFYWGVEKKEFKRWQSSRCLFLISSYNLITKDTLVRVDIQMQTQIWMAKQIYSQSCQYRLWSDFSWFLPSGLNAQLVNIDVILLTPMESNWIRWARDLNVCHSLLSQISCTKKLPFYFHKDVMPSRKSLFLHQRLCECFSGICCLAEAGWCLVKQCMKPVGQVNTVSTRENFHHCLPYFLT